MRALRSGILAKVGRFCLTVLALPAALVGFVLCFAAMCTLYLGAWFVDCAAVAAGLNVAPLASRVFAGFRGDRQVREPARDFAQRDADYTDPARLNLRDVN